MIDYHPIETVEEMQQVVDLEIDVWGLNPVDAVPVNVLRMAIHNGGVVIAATQQSVMLGFAVGLPAKRDNELILWSHITGVHPEHQSKGIGYHLKQTQRLWAKDNGYDAIGWTFDPFQTRNAHFNLNRLDAVAIDYHDDFYGRMTDTINNNGLPSDRLEIRWAVDVENQERSSEKLDEVDIRFWVDQREGAIDLGNFGEQSLYVGIVIPRTSNERQVYQKHIRNAFHKAFDMGYQADSFVRKPDKDYYRLTHKS